MKYLILLILPFWFLNSPGVVNTVGISHVTTIELKAAAFQKNVSKIGELNALLPALILEQDKEIQKISQEIERLYSDKEKLIGDMKIGARCSECGTWKSEFEKRGVNFQKHLGDVKGYAIPASTGELEKTRKQFNEKIALKKVQLQNLKNGYGPLASTQEEIQTLEDKNELICKEITAESKKYETTVFSDGKEKHQNWTEAILEHASHILIAQDKITIYHERGIRYKKEFREESERIKERVEAETTSLEKEKTDAIQKLQEQKEAEIAQVKELLTTYDEKINALREQLIALETERYSRTANDSVLQAKYELLNNQLEATEKERVSIETESDKRIAGIAEKIDQLNADIFTLKSELVNRQEEEIKKIEPAFERKIQDAKTQEIAAGSALTQAKNNYDLALRKYNSANDAFLKEIELETFRMIAAGEKIGCSVWKTTKGMAATNWNKVLPCVKALPALAKPFSANIFNSYCPETAVTSKLSMYKSFLSGLDASDLEAVKQSSNSDWYENMMN